MAADKVSLALSNLECFAGLFLSSANLYFLWSVLSTTPRDSVSYLPVYAQGHEDSILRQTKKLCLHPELFWQRVGKLARPHTPSLGRLRSWVLGWEGRYRDRHLEWGLKRLALWGLPAPLSGIGMSLTWALEGSSLQRSLETFAGSLWSPGQNVFSKIPICV